MKMNSEIFLKQDRGIMEISYTDRVSDMKPYLHAHPGVQFVWLENFDGTLQTGENVSPAAGANVCMIGDQMPHRLISNTEKIQATNLLLSKEYLEELLTGSSTSELVMQKSPYFLWNIETAQSEKVVHMNKQESSKMDRLVSAMRQECSDMGKDWSVMLDCMMKEFVIRLLHALPERSIERFRTVQSVGRYLEENLSKQFVLEELAAEFGFHKSHLCRMFKEVKQESMYEYVARVRCEAAARRMEESCLSITEISQDVGFSDYNQFVKYFKRYMGDAPAQWRKSRRNFS